MFLSALPTIPAGVSQAFMLLNTLLLIILFLYLEFSDEKEQDPKRSHRVAVYPFIICFLLLVALSVVRQFVRIPFL